MRSAVVVCTERTSIDRKASTDSKWAGEQMSQLKHHIVYVLRGMRYEISTKQGVDLNGIRKVAGEREFDRV